MFTMCKVKLTCKVLPSGNLKHLIYKQRNVSFSSLAALMFDLKDKERGRCTPPQHSVVLHAAVSTPTSSVTGV